MGTRIKHCLAGEPVAPVIFVAKNRSNKAASRGANRTGVRQ